MSWLFGFWRTAVGAKVVMAVTGLMLFGFTLVHMAGNLQVFLGHHYMDEYSRFLHSMPELLWPARLALLTAVLLHIWSWLRLRGQSAAARPVGYQKKQSRAATVFSKSMRVTGPIVLIFLILHLLNLTIGVVHPDFKMQGGGIEAPAAFHNLTTLMRQWPAIGVFYILANLALGGHLWHGAFSMARTLGLSGENQLNLARAIASALTFAVVGGNVLVATACTLGLVK